MIKGFICVPYLSTQNGNVPGGFRKYFLHDTAPYQQK